MNLSLKCTNFSYRGGFPQTLLEVPRSTYKKMWVDYMMIYEKYTFYYLIKIHHQDFTTGQLSFFLFLLL